jgi:hypothetical protein
MRISCKNVTLTHLAIRQVKSVSSLYLLRIVVNKSHYTKFLVNLYYRTIDGNFDSIRIITKERIRNESATWNESGTNHESRTNQERIMNLERIRNAQKIGLTPSSGNMEPPPVEIRLDPSSGNMVD